MLPPSCEVSSSSFGQRGSQTTNTAPTTEVWLDDDGRRRVKPLAWQRENQGNREPPPDAPFQQVSPRDLPLLVRTQNNHCSWRYVLYLMHVRTDNKLLPRDDNNTMEVKNWIINPANILGIGADSVAHSEAFKIYCGFLSSWHLICCCPWQRYNDNVKSALQDWFSSVFTPRK